MKNITLAFFGFLAFNATSQTSFTLTKAGQEPAQGDSRTILEYDSVGVVPKSTGANQNWNFTSVQQTTYTAFESYVSPSTVPSSSLFPGTTLVSSDGSGSYNFFKSSSSPSQKFEQLGYIDVSFPPAYGKSYVLNPKTLYNWPITSGTTFTDSFASIDIGSIGSSTGTSTTTCSGSGTITLPNGAVYSNILQLRTIAKENSVYTFSNISVTFTTTEVTYNYFHPTQKFPLLIASYFVYDDGDFKDTYLYLGVNSVITVGIKDQAKNNSFLVYPNPAKDKIILVFDNPSGEVASVEIYDLVGKNVLTKSLDNAIKINETIDLARFEKGIYVLKIVVGTSVQSTKLVIE
jgi:hypothetical protein